VYQQVLLANPDQAVFVFACAHPNPKLRMLDRFLVAAEKQKIPAVIVANKTDLVDDPEKIFGMYTQIGIRHLQLSFRRGGSGIASHWRERSARWPGHPAWESPACSTLCSRGWP
jgi:ribosome biogenesis GTPase